MDIQNDAGDGWYNLATKIIRTLYIVDKSVITKKIRTLNAKDKSAIPIIALTANALKGDGERYLEIGMNGYVTKPYTEEKLFHVISQVIRTNNNMRLTSAIASPILDTATPPGPDEKFYDLTFINSISQGDKEFAKKIIVIFQETMPALVDALVKAGNEKIPDVVSKTAHKMKSNIDLLGIHALKDVIRKLENIELSDEERDGYIQKVKYTLKEAFVQLKEHV